MPPSVINEDTVKKLTEVLTLGQTVQTKIAAMNTACRDCFAIVQEQDPLKLQQKVDILLGLPSSFTADYKTLSLSLSRVFWNQAKVALYLPILPHLLYQKSMLQTFSQVKGGILQSIGFNINYASWKEDFLNIGEPVPDATYKDRVTALEQGLSAAEEVSVILEGKVNAVDQKTDSQGASLLGKIDKNKDNIESLEARTSQTEVKNAELATLLSQAASQAVVETLRGLINSKANQVDLDALRSSFADRSFLIPLVESLAQKVDKTALTSLTTSIALKVDQTALTPLTTAIALKADQSALTALSGSIAQKANQSDLTTLTGSNQAQINSMQSQVSSMQSLVSSMQSQMTSMQSQISSLQSQVASLRTNPS
ncbi:hypothetical protein AGMMS49949_04570 [Alphaproteobacteria bacterium]|nr:hypothetical protein AGMMS49949_04570 [Alphaproteobacteria bacterium]GHS95726.1 hypothetical protein AGMMS50296_0710 [Alphaproteobacteria bacterium]